MKNSITVELKGQKVTLEESDILTLIEVTEGYFDMSDPSKDFYFKPLSSVIKKIHGPESLFWDDFRKDKIVASDNIWSSKEKKE